MIVNCTNAWKTQGNYRGLCASPCISLNETNFCATQGACWAKHFTILALDALDELYTWHWYCIIEDLLIIVQDAMWFRWLKTLVLREFIHVHLHILQSHLKVFKCGFCGFMQVEVPFSKQATGYYIRTGNLSPDLDLKTWIYNFTTDHWQRWSAPNSSFGDVAVGKIVNFETIFGYHEDKHFESSSK